MIPRRGLLAGLGALLAAPAIIRTPGLLMPVRPIREPLSFEVDWPATATFYRSMALFDAEGRIVAYDEIAEISNEALLSLEDVQSVYGTNRSHTEMWMENLQGPVWKFPT